MRNKTLVVVSDLDDSGHAEINVVDGAEMASRLVETLLEEGCDKERIRVFSAEEMDMRVTQRPVVALTVAEDEQPLEEDQRDAEEEREEAEKESPVLATDDAQAEPVVSSMMPPHAPVMDSSPYTRDGVRFSSLFRPA